MRGRAIASQSQPAESVFHFSGCRFISPGILRAIHPAIGAQGPKTGTPYPCLHLRCNLPEGSIMRFSRRFIFVRPIQVPGRHGGPEIRSGLKQSRYFRKWRKSIPSRAWSVLMRTRQSAIRKPEMRMGALSGNSTVNRADLAMPDKVSGVSVHYSSRVDIFLARASATFKTVPMSSFSQGGKFCASTWRPLFFLRTLLTTESCRPAASKKLSSRVHWPNIFKADKNGNQPEHP